MNSTAVYNTIGKTYDLTRKADPEIVTQIVKLLGNKSAGRYLDMGCGTGNYTAALRQQGLTIEGIDVSEEMLNKARLKYPEIHFHHGSATKLPFNDAIFAGLSCILATHHINDNDKLFQEAFRVLNDQGRLVIFTATPEQMKQYWLCHYFPKLMADSIKKMSSIIELQDSLKRAGFKNIQQIPFYITNRLQDWFLNAGKYRPEIYLDPKVRNGISSFHLSVDPDELTHGLAQLEQDIQSNHIKQIITEYESDLGDYLFVVGEQ